MTLLLYGNSIFNANMPIKRFRFLCATFVLMTSTRESNSFNITDLLQLELFFKLFVNNCEKVMIPNVDLYWMRHCIPQELVLPLVKITKANRQNTSCYCEASRALNYHTPIHQFLMLVNQ